MSYTTYDFHESLNSAKRDGVIHFGVDDVRHVHAAWGHSPEGFGSWEGGFLMELKDGTFVYLTGWCDTTGWGCQDGAKAEHFDTKPQLPGLPETGEYDDEPIGDWDLDPADLNRYVRHEIERHDDPL